MTDFGIDPIDYLTGVERERALTCIVGYLSECTGAWFNRLADPDPHRLTASDLVAVTTLSVQVPPDVTIWVEQHTSDISSLLRSIPTGRIQDVAEAELSEQSSAQRLWELLQKWRWPVGQAEDNGVGPVTAGKLLAVKRPALIPVWDRAVEEGLRPPQSGFWLAMWRRFQDGAFVDAVRSVRDEVLARCASEGIEVPSELSDLRVLDIVVWMRVLGCKDDRRSRPELRALADVPLGG